MLMRSKRVSLWLAVLMICGVAVVALTMTSSSNTVKKNHLHVATTKYAVSTRLTGMFKVLDRDTSAHNASAAVTTQSFPSHIAQVMTHTHPGLDPSAAVFAGGADPTWVVPGTTEVCLIYGPMPEGGYGGVCDTIAAAAHGLAVYTEGAGHDPIVIGLVPNGNTSVQVTNADGSKESVPVANNVYEIVGHDPSTVNLMEASGTRTTRHLPSPPPAP